MSLILIHHIRKAGISNLLSFLPVCILMQSDANKFTAQKGDKAQLNEYTSV